MSWETSLLNISQILGLFANTLTTDEKYSLHNTENLQQPIQIQLPRKANFFCELFAAYLKST